MSLTGRAHHDYTRSGPRRCRNCRNVVNIFTKLCRSCGELWTPASSQPKARPKTSREATR